MNAVALGSAIFYIKVKISSFKLVIKCVYVFFRMLQTNRKCIWGIDIFGNILTHSINSIRLIDQNGRNVTFFVNSSFVSLMKTLTLTVTFDLLISFLLFSFHHNYHQSQQWNKKFLNFVIKVKSRSIDDFFVQFLNWETKQNNGKTMVPLLMLLSIESSFIDKNQWMHRIDDLI